MLTAPLGEIFTFTPNLLSLHNCQKEKKNMLPSTFVPVFMEKRGPSLALICDEG